MTTQQRAAESVNTPRKMIARLNSAKSVLRREHVAAFKGAEFIAPNGLQAKCGKFALIWENDGHSTRGGVALWEMKRLSGSHTNG